MRPRFSIRLLLVIIALFAVGLYFLFVRPTVIANRFIEKIQAGDYEAAQSVVSYRNRAIIPDSAPNRSLDRVYAEVLPREWSDIWAFQRRLLLRISFHDDTRGGRIEWVEDSDIVAGVNGLRLIGGDL